MGKEEGGWGAVGWEAEGWAVGVMAVVEGMGQVEMAMVAGGWVVVAAMGWVVRGWVVAVVACRLAGSGSICCCWR